MGELDSIDDEVGSIFDEPAEPAEPAAAAVSGSTVAAASGMSERVNEFVPLDRRRVHANPALTPAEEERWAELREWFDYEFGVGSPPLAGSRRRSLRVPAQHKVAVAGTRSATAILANVSSDGAFLEIDEALAPETRLDLTIDPGDGQAPIAVAATVQWAREIGNMDGPAGVGVAFVDVDDDTFLALEQLVHRALAEAAAEAR